MDETKIINTIQGSPRKEVDRKGARDIDFRGGDQALSRTGLFS